MSSVTRVCDPWSDGILQTVNIGWVNSEIRKFKSDRKITHLRPDILIIVWRYRTPRSGGNKSHRLPYTLFPPAVVCVRPVCRTHRGVMSNIRMTTNVGINHVAHMTESCPAYEYVTYRHEPRHTHEWVASHMNKVTHVKASCHACRRVIFLRNMCISISMWLSVDALDAPL